MKIILLKSLSNSSLSKNSVLNIRALKLDNEEEQGFPNNWNTPIRTGKRNEISLQRMTIYSRISFAKMLKYVTVALSLS